MVLVESFRNSGYSMVLYIPVGLEDLEPKETLQNIP